MYLNHRESDRFLLAFEACNLRRDVRSAESRDGNSDEQDADNVASVSLILLRVRSSQSRVDTRGLRAGLVGGVGDSAGLG